MDLHELFYEWMSEYSEVLETVKANRDYKNPFRDIIAKTIPDKLSDLLKLSEPYTVVGSYGKGRWTDVPWIAVFDERITKSAQKGVYIVYLLNKNSKELYLSLEIAATEVMENRTGSDGRAIFTGVVGKSSPELVKKLSTKADSIRTVLKDHYFKSDNQIDSGSSGYDWGTIYYKKYTLDRLPTEQSLVNDLERMMQLYKQYYEYTAFGDGHTIGVFYSWKILSMTIAVKHCDRSFFEHNGSGIPKEICWFFDAEDLGLGEKKQITLNYNGTEYQGRVVNESSDRRRVRIFWGTDLGKAFGEFEGKDVTASFHKLDTGYYEVEIRCTEGSEPEMTVAETIQAIKTYIVDKGFSYEDGLIENFYLSLKSKPFVILAGTSGTGKTKLVKLFAEAVGSTTYNERYKMVSVRPDWSDSTDLFGHVDLNGRFIPGAVIDFIKKAELDEKHPYFLCLDEMNLARVEYYLSDILSVIETRELKNGHITTDDLVPDTYYGADVDSQKKYGAVKLPENLYLIGTVNMDETTFPFSRKVLDRANTIEFSHVDLTAYSFSDGTEPAAQDLPNSFLKSEYLLLTQCGADEESVNEYCSELQEINRILAKANAHVGYRVRDEIVFYMLNNKHSGLLSQNDAMDNEIMQKILPRIQGSSASVKEMLCELLKKCTGDFEGFQTQNIDMKELIEKTKNARYKKSANKICYMIGRYQEDGFTSYWL